MFLAAPSISAQEVTEETTNNYDRYLPKAGDVSIGADALPYLEFLGNMFNDTQNNTLNLGSNTLYFKYFLQDDKAVRAIIKINNSTNNNKQYVADDFARLDPLSTALAEDLMVTKNNSVDFSIGYQIYKTRNRLAGYYGAQIGYGYGKTKYDYTYANPYTALNQTPSTSNFGSNISGSNRMLQQTNGLTQNVSVGVFIGVEYFFMPKISIGGEYALSYQRSWSKQSNASYEGWNGSNLAEVDAPFTPSQSNSSLATSRPATYGGLYLSFYF